MYRVHFKGALNSGEAQPVPTPGLGEAHPIPEDSLETQGGDHEAPTETIAVHDLVFLVSQLARVAFFNREDIPPTTLRCRTFGRL